MTHTKLPLQLAALVKACLEFNKGTMTFQALNPYWNPLQKTNIDLATYAWLIQNNQTPANYPDVSDWDAVVEEIDDGLDGYYDTALQNAFPDTYTNSDYLALFGTKTDLCEINTVMMRLFAEYLEVV